MSRTACWAATGFLLIMPLTGKGQVQPAPEHVWTAENASLKDHTATLEKQGALLLTRNSYTNFALKCKAKTTPGAEARIVFHTTVAARDKQGYQVVINNSDYRSGNAQKTGSLALIRNNFVRTASDDAWFDLEIAVKANVITVSVNGKRVSEYVQPDMPRRIAGLEGRVLSKGLIVCEKMSGPGSVILSELKLESLPDNLAKQSPDPLAADATADALNELNQIGFPLIDFHGHLKGGLTVDQVCAHGRMAGYNYGLSPNCGLNFPVTNDSTLAAYYKTMAPEPVFKAMQCEGREWITLFTPPNIALYDYIFTDGMTWTDDKGRRMRLWMPGETFVDDEQQFMDMLVARIEAILNQEPVDIYVNPTYLPEVIAAGYDRLWTPERMDRVIRALKNNDVALEINARFRIPGIEFIKRAKAAGVKFTLGTNNADNTDLNRLEYCIKAIREAGITPSDIFLPRPPGDKKVLKKGLPSKITG